MICYKFVTWLFYKSTNCIVFLSENFKSQSFDYNNKENSYTVKLDENWLYGKYFKSKLNIFAEYSQKLK